MSAPLGTFLPWGVDAASAAGLPLEGPRKLSWLAPGWAASSDPSPDARIGVYLHNPSFKSSSLKGVPGMPFGASNWCCASGAEGRGHAQSRGMQAACLVAAKKHASTAIIREQQYKLKTKGKKWYWWLPAALLSVREGWLCCHGGLRAAWAATLQNHHRHNIEHHLH